MVRTALRAPFYLPQLSDLVPLATSQLSSHGYTTLWSNHPLSQPQPSCFNPFTMPDEQTLVSVSTVGTFDNLSDAALEAEVRKQLSTWFGAKEVDSWSHLRTYRIPFAQPNQVSAGAGRLRISWAEALPGWPIWLFAGRKAGEGDSLTG